MPKDDEIDAKKAEKIAAAKKAITVAYNGYERGKVSWPKLQSVSEKVAPILEDDRSGALWIQAVEQARKDLIAKNRKILADTDPTTLEAKTWKSVKKEAGIKKSGFLKKSDANVSKYLKNYQSAHKKYEKSAEDPHGQSVKACQDMLIANKKLQEAFDKFLNAKEFKSEISKDLQSTCQKMKKTLDDQFKALAAHATDTKKEVEQMQRQLDSLFG